MSIPPRPGGTRITGGGVVVLLAGLMLNAAPAPAAAQQDLVPEARQILNAYAAIVKRMPAAARQVLSDWLREWPTLEEADRTALVDLVERLRYVPADVMTEALRDVQPAKRRQALIDLFGERGYFQAEPTRALIVIAGVGTPADTIVGGDRERYFPRVWRHIRRDGLLLEEVLVKERNRSHPKWAAALMCGRYTAVGPDGRARVATLYEALRKARGVPRTATWLVTSGPLLTRADYSTDAEFGEELGAVQVSSSLFDWADRRRAERAERLVRDGAKRSVAVARTRSLRISQLGLDNVYADADIRSFVTERMDREPGANIRNTFIYITALRAIHKYNPHLMVVCFGEPGEDFKDPPRRPRERDSPSVADYQLRLRLWRRRVDQWREDLPKRRQAALVDLDVHVDYLYREFKRNPYYGARGMFVLILGDPERGAVEAIIVGPETPAGASRSRRCSIVQVAPTLAKFLDIPLPEATGSLLEKALGPLGDTGPGQEASTTRAAPRGP